VRVEPEVAGWARWYHSSGDVEERFHGVLWALVDELVGCSGFDSGAMWLVFQL